MRPQEGNAPDAGLADRQQAAAGQAVEDCLRMDESEPQAPVRRDGDGDGAPDRRDPLGSAKPAAAGGDRRVPCTDMVSAKVVESPAFRRARLRLHPQSGLLEAHDRKPDAGAVVLRGLHGAGRAGGHLGGAPSQDLCRADPGAGPDADASDLRLPDPGNCVLRHRHGARPDCHGDLCAARANPHDATGHILHSATAAGSGHRLWRYQTAGAVESGTALCPAADHGGAEPDHHAVAVDGGDRGAGGRQRAGCAGGAGAELGQYRARV
ncbi:UNVERIFIED_CONTAM: hypothetical protein NCL1_02799 [Trichonephila clavipes]